MNGLDIPNNGFTIDVSPLRSCWSRAIDQKLSQVSPLDQVIYLLLQLETVFFVKAAILVKLTLLVLVSLEWFCLNLPIPFHELLILDFYKYLSNGDVERRQN